MRSTVTLGPFQLRAPIARGGMGEVWLGHHPGRGLDVAVKVMTGHQLQKLRGREAFRNEVRAVAGLDHPAIVRVFDHGEVPPEAAAASRGRLSAGTPYLVMELVRGGSLRTVQPRNWDELRSVLLELLEALAHAHARGVIHRDLKPGNVLVAAPDEAGAGLRISDFGLAATVDDPSLPLRSRFIMGTLQYMAPEQVAGHLREIGPWTDLYALGCMAWRLATGTRAFESEDTRELIHQQLEAPPPEFHPFLAVPDGFEGWLLRLLHKDPARRFVRAGDAAWALIGLGGATGEPAPPPGPEPLGTSGSYKRLSGGRPLSWTGWTSRQWSVPEQPLREPPGADTSIDDPSNTHALSTVNVSSQPGPRGAWNDPLPPLPEDWRSLHRAPRNPVPLGVGLGLLGLRPHPIVGRDDERDVLWAALREVVERGATRSIVLTGPSGIGKSRLVQWLAETAHESGHATVLRATHSQIPGPTDGLGPMIGRHLACVGLTPAEARERVRRVLMRMGVDDPWEWAAVTELVSPSPRGAEAVGPVVRFGHPRERDEVIRRLLLWEARRRPVLLWLDDVQWSESTVEFAELLLDEPLRHPVLIVATARTEAGAEPWSSRLSEGLSRGHLAVPPLARSAQADLLASLIGLAPRVSAEVLRRTEGRPLYATQILSDWVGRDVLRPTPDGYTVPDAELALPESVQTLQTRRLDRVLDALDDLDGLAAVEIAAALGRSVSQAEWEAACAAADTAVAPTLVGALTDHALAQPMLQGWRWLISILSLRLR